ncbi:hypothetical protein Tco_0513743 [Tanacetum coccineum]
MGKVVEKVRKVVVNGGEGSDSGGAERERRRSKKKTNDIEKKLYQISEQGGCSQTGTKHIVTVGASAVPLDGFQSELLRVFRQ